MTKMKFEKWALSLGDILEGVSKATSTVRIPLPIVNIKCVYYCYRDN